MIHVHTAHLMDITIPIIPHIVTAIITIHIIRHIGRNMSRNELKQYLIDFESGKILEFDVDNTELLLMKDNKLYEEYVQLSRKKRKDLMFVYIRKFNENNPLYIPQPAQ